MIPQRKKIYPENGDVNFREPERTVFPASVQDPRKISVPNTRNFAASTISLELLPAHLENSLESEAIPKKRKHITICFYAIVKKEIFLKYFCKTTELFIQPGLKPRAVMPGQVRGCDAAISTTEVG